MSTREGVNATGLGAGVSGIGLLFGQLPDKAATTPWWPWIVATGAAFVLAALVVALRRHPFAQATVIGAAGVALGIWLATDLVPGTTAGRAYWPLIAGGGALVLLLTFALWLYRREGSAGRVTRLSRRSRRNEGTASAFAIWRTSGRHAARRKAAVMRPSFRELPFYQRMRTPTREFASPIARFGLVRIWSPVEDVTLRIGGPRTGKTGELACRILDAPGAVIATSTRTDLIELTSLCRSQGGPVAVFNPSGVGGLDSTVTFSPLSGCEHPAVATTRAADLLAGVSAPGRDGGDREFWSGQAKRVLASLMHAAALGGAGMRDVLSWVADPDNAAQAVSKFLRRSPESAYETDALQFLGMNERTRSSICATIMPALGWLTDSTAAAAAAKGDFDVETLLEQRGTVYMLGAEEAQVAPLVTALTGHIAREARRLAGLRRGGRLDPPLTLALDEAALICPVPLDNWTADMGGRGVTIHIAAQSRAQLRQRWGDTGAAAIMNNVATLLIYGGTRDPEDLNAYSTLTGEREEKVPTFDADGNVTATTTRRIPVLSAGQIAQLPAKHAVVIRRGLAPAVGKVQMAWTRRDVKAAIRRQRWDERLERWAELRDRFADGLADRVEAADRRFWPAVERWRRSRGATRRPRPGESDGGWS